MSKKRKHKLLENILREAEDDSDSIFKPRNLEGRYEQRVEQLKNQLKDVKVYDGSLDLTWLPDSVTSLSDIAPDLKKVEGGLYLENTPAKDLGSLQEVGGSLYLQNTPIEDLGNLKQVGEYLYLQNTPINDLGNLQEVGGNLHLGKQQKGKVKGLEDVQVDEQIFYI